MEPTQFQTHTNELCSVLSEQPTNSENIFDKIFELLELDSKDDKHLWKDTCYGFCEITTNNITTTTRPVDLMTQYFYKSSRILIKDDKSYYIDNVIPSILLLQLLLRIINRVRDGPYNGEWLANFGSTAYASDGNGILSVGMGSNLEYIKYVTTEDIPKIEKALKDITDEFDVLGFNYEGNNYTLGQVVGIYCQKLLEYRQKKYRQNGDKSKRPKRSRDTGVGGNTNEYDWRSYIRRATPDEISIYTTNKNRQDVSPADSAKSKAESKQMFDHLKEQLARINATNMGSKPSKKPKLTPKCPRGSDCYRKNPEHLREFYHPGRSPPPETKKHWRPGGGSGKSTRTRRRRLSSTTRTRRRLSSTKRTRRRPSTKRSTKRR